MSRVGQMIKEARMKKGMSPKQLGNKCGVSESFILEVERGTKIINEKLIAQISKVLGANLEENVVLEVPREEEKPKEVIKKKPQSIVDRVSVNRTDVEPLDQWSEALSNIIKKVPIYDIGLSNVKGYKDFPIIDKKVEGFNPDKLVYVELSDDNMSKYRMKKGDRCLIYLNHEFMNNTFQLVEYDNKKYLRKVKKQEGNKIQLIEGTKDDNFIIKDMKEIKIIGRLIRVEIDFN